MAVTKEIWEFMEKHLGYSDEEKALFRKNPRNADVLDKGQALMGKTIVFEVVDSHGCNSRHMAGDKFYFDGAGNLLTKLNPSRICVFALAQLAGLVFAANELLYAGVDPNEIRFKHTGCFDVGVRCGGWGHINMKMSVVDRK
jgi:uncharacterized repeat protein (TIGR04076 family)